MEYRKVYSKRKELFSSSIHLPCRTLLSSQVMDLWTTVNVRMSESTLENDSFAKLWFKFYWFPITKKFIFCFTLHFILTPSKTNFSTIIHKVCLVLKCTGILWYLTSGMSTTRNMSTTRDISTNVRDMSTYVTVPAEMPL